MSLTCSTTVLGSQDATIYFAELSRNFDEVNATWMLPNTAQSWNLMGADGSSDRGDFEPPISITMNTTFSLNVTKIAQDSARNNQSTMSVIVASLGAEYNCAMSENTNSQSRPSLTLDYSSSPMGNGGSFDVDFVNDGAAVTDGSFLLNADTTPSPAWTNGTGSNMEIQFSLADDWQNVND